MLSTDINTEKLISYFATKQNLKEISKDLMSLKEAVEDLTATIDYMRYSHLRYLDDISSQK